MNALYAAIYATSFCLVCTVILLAIRRSAFGFLLASFLIWFLVGSCVYPLLNALGMVHHGREVTDFINRNNEPGMATALHILFASIGMLCGYVYRPRNAVSDHAARWVAARVIGAKDALVWRCSLLLGICAYLLYFYLVGFELALTNAASARGGDFEGFGEGERFLFLKTVAAIGFVATSFLPLALLTKNKVFIVAYCLLVATAYANSISRNLLLYGVIVPVLVYVRLRMDVQGRRIKPMSYVIAAALLPFAWLVLNYGKLVGHSIRAYFTGDYYSLVEEGADSAVLDVLLENFGFQWVSVQAGIDHFFRTGGPLVTPEQFLAALFGAVPSRILGFLGLDMLYYGNVSAQLTCVNSAAFGYQECTVPPLTFGYSAYLLPGAGGFLIGFVWLRICAALERMWLALQSANLHKLWIPYFLAGAVMDFFTFLPSAVAMAATQFVWLLILRHLRFKPLWPVRNAHVGWNR